MTKVTEAQARKILADAHSEQCFWMHDGGVVKNLYQLEEAIKHISDEQFAHHCNHTKNDFSLWILEALGDVSLADSLKDVTKKESCLKKIHARIRELEHIIDKKIEVDMKLGPLPPESRNNLPVQPKKVPIRFISLLISFFIGFFVGFLVSLVLLSFVFQVS